jgi:hypothetical protein
VSWDAARFVRGVAGGIGAAARQVGATSTHKGGTMVALPLLALGTGIGIIGLIILIAIIVIVIRII